MLTTTPLDPASNTPLAAIALPSRSPKRADSAHAADGELLVHAAAGRHIPCSWSRRAVAVFVSLCCQAAIVYTLSMALLPPQEKFNDVRLVCTPIDDMPLDDESPIEESLNIESAAFEMPASLESANQAEISLVASRWSSELIPPFPSVSLARKLTTRKLSVDEFCRSARGGDKAQCEHAVEDGLRWIVSRQHDDGHWSFALQHGPPVSNPGTDASTTAATSLALLPLLAAGNTHRQGDHRAAVARGLEYLCSRMIETRHGGDFQEGTMYGQALAAMALAKAYSWSGDERLRPYAQAAVDFICNAQHADGGWRYRPREPGDTTVTGWQFMALASGKLAGLDVDAQALPRAMRFLDSVQSDGGAKYGYRRVQPAPTDTATAVALLCRMHGGWQPAAPAIMRGVEYLNSLGPSADDVYFNYYAAQVLRQAGGSRWPAWNARMRGHLIATQAASGPEDGSWHFNHRYGNVGGRLYSTSLALLTLEASYRHLPLYADLRSQ